MSNVQTKKSHLSAKQIDLTLFEYSAMYSSVVKGKLFYDKSQERMDVAVKSFTDISVNIQVSIKN